MDNATVATFHELQIYVWRRGWSLRATDRFSKRKRRILIVKPGVSRGFQIDVPFDVDSIDFKQPGIWIYGLVAKSRYSKSCYIGQSANIMRRMAEHAKRSRTGRGSDSFFDWTVQNNVTAHVILLELVKSENTKGETARRATVLEGSWLQAAIVAGYQTPDIHQWGKLPRDFNSKRTFHETRVWNAAKPFDAIVDNSPPLKSFWLGPV